MYIQPEKAVKQYGEVPPLYLTADIWWENLPVEIERAINITESSQKR